MDSKNHQTHVQRSTLLRSTTHAFLTAFTNPTSNPPVKLLASFFTPHGPRITEHGPAWATARLPFLGRTFTGVEACLEYFDLLGQTLEAVPQKEDTFPGPEGFVVDADAVVGRDESGMVSSVRGVVSVAGKATFRSVKTGREWHESFIFRLSGFDEDGKIGHWEIWADPLSAWKAVVED